MPSSPTSRRLQRVLGLARLDALSMIVVAAPAALIALGARDTIGFAVGSGVALCGAAEWHGRARLLRRQISGIAWLCSAQLLCLLLILYYAWNLGQLAGADHILALLPSFTREQLADSFPDPESLTGLLLGIQRLMAGALALASLIYQGAMALYYLRSAPAARAVFAEPPVLASVTEPHGG
jgi:hypothetical protein